ncbi:MAG TPA: DAK2 domain-containing protein [Clostridia bacterium]|nr:DAK2 domain-containing protein [Clostridia bacterium]HOS18022.1 DAK2 domain-containing protein [Clostridia bacterium]HPK15121.1 DAK2 domain-containing protein [Clostridia bacterium]
MENTTIGGAMLRDMLLMGTALLDKNRAHIDSLNVFPVPDGDTGSNMLMTMQSAVREIREVRGEKVGDIAAAASLGSLKGARGNSGVILSQIFRGFARALAGKEEMDGAALSSALSMGTEAAYKAVMKPKEGTMLTVSRVMAESVAEAADSGANVYKLVDVMLESGEAALRHTPEQLPVLKEAGVVDSGGKGLLTILRGFKMVMDGEEVDDYVEEERESFSQAASSEEGADLEGLEEIEFGYCTEFFIIHLDDASCEADLDKFRDKLVKIGDSVVVAKDEGVIKVHVHSNYPGKIIQLALRLGEVDRIKIENMREQNRGLLEHLRKTEKENAVVAVSAGPGLEEVFRALGVTGIIPGGQTMNPSVESISRAIRKANARNVFVLPNNPNVLFAARQAAQLASRNVKVIPTTTMVQGISAALAFSEDVSADDNAAQMEDAMNGVLSGSVTYAVRASKVNGSSIAEGDIIGLLDGDIAEVGSGVDEVTLKLLRRMMDKKKGDAVVTLFFGEGMDEQNAKAIIDQAETEYPRGEFTVQYGGQPLYYYLISVE